MLLKRFSFQSIYLTKYASYIIRNRGKVQPLIRDSTSQRYFFANTNQGVNLNNIDVKISNLDESGSHPEGYNKTMSPPNNAYKNSVGLDQHKVFVSKHFQMDNEEIFRFLDYLKCEYKTRPSGQIVLKFCPFCPKHHYNKLDNMWTLNLKSNSGVYLCFRCAAKGSWFDFKNTILGSNNIDFAIESYFDNDSQKKRMNSSTSVSEPKIASESLTFWRYKNLINKEFPLINEYLTSTENNEFRHLKIEVLENYKVGVGLEKFLNEDGEFVEKACVYFPMFAPKSDKSIKIPKSDSKQKKSSTEETKDKPEEPSQDKYDSISDSHYILIRNKIRAIGKANKHYQRMEPTGGYWGLFGLNTVPIKARSVVITEGEFDAMAVYQATGYPAISLPNGASSLPLQVLPWLEKFEKIYLWMDADIMGQTNAANFAQKLGVNRTFLVNTKRFDPNGPKDANDALRDDPESLKKYLMDARPITQENVTTFAEMKDSVLNRILRHNENIGIQSEYFAWYNKKLKGFRRGELTIVTGATGSGKTSFLSQLSLDFAKKGVSTLWGSFEVRNDILMTNMLMQFSGINLIANPKKFDFYAEQFEKLPLYFLKFYGSTEIDKIINTIDFAMYAYDVGHVIIDNLQFLLSGQGRGFERFDLQDDAISKLRTLATTKNVHITLVIHPKKVDDNQDLTINSVFGSAKATQEADNILILQNRPKYRIIEVRKNRFDGDLGKSAIGFDRNTKKFLELTEEEVFDLHRTPVTFKQLLERREEKSKLYEYNTSIEMDNSNVTETNTVNLYENIHQMVEKSHKTDGNNSENIEISLESSNKTVYENFESLELDGSPLEEFQSTIEKTIIREGGITEKQDASNSKIQKKVIRESIMANKQDMSGSTLRKDMVREVNITENKDDSSATIEKDVIREGRIADKQNTSSSSSSSKRKSKVTKTNKTNDDEKPQENQPQESSQDNSLDVVQEPSIIQSKRNQVENSAPRTEQNKSEYAEKLSQEQNDKDEIQRPEQPSEKSKKSLYSIKKPSWKETDESKTSFYKEEEKSFVFDNVKGFLEPDKRKFQSAYPKKERQKSKPGNSNSDFSDSTKNEDEIDEGSGENSVKSKNPKK